MNYLFLNSIIIINEKYVIIALRGFFNIKIKYNYYITKLKLYVI